MCNTVHVTWHERQRFILDVDTATFVYMHPCEEKKDGCRELLTLPRISTADEGVDDILEKNGSPSSDLLLIQVMLSETYG